MKPNTKRTICQILLMICAYLLSMGLFYTSYRYDNKYMLNAHQPIGGILFFDPDTDSTTHLINGWQYYRGRLLTPADFTGKLPFPDGYVSIGQYPGMEMGRPEASPHGSVTYRINLALPDTPASYTLELPEIYSAYRLYIGDTLAASQGNPEKEAYRPEIRSGSVTFEASGNTQIILAVSDWSWLYSGLVYPPAFGSAIPMSLLLKQKFAWGLTVTVLALLLGVFLTGITIIQKSCKALYSALVCIAFSVSVSSMPLHQLLTTEIVPFYNLELLSRYAVYGISVLLVNHIYGKRSLYRTASSVIAVTFLFLALFVSFAAPVLSLPAMLMFSHASGIYKAACAVWILCTSFLIERKGNSSASSLILLTGACVFASSLIADRLWPCFEPIRYGWFSEIAGLIFILLISVLMFMESLLLYRERFLLLQKGEQLQLQIKLQKSHYADLVGEIQKSRSIRHDAHHHYTQLHLLLQISDYKGAKSYLEQVSETIPTMVPLNLCKNYMADVLLRYYYAKAQESDIPFTIHAELPEHIGLPDDEFSVILGNMLENALEASLRLPAVKRSIHFSITLHSGNNLIIESRNAFNGWLEKKDGSYISAKEENRTGIGIASLQAIASKYDGNVWIDTEQNTDGAVFIIRVFLITNTYGDEKLTH